MNSLTSASFNQFRIIFQRANYIYQNPTTNYADLINTKYRSIHNLILNKV